MKQDRLAECEAERAMLTNRLMGYQDQLNEMKMAQEDGLFETAIVVQPEPPEESSNLGARLLLCSVIAAILFAVALTVRLLTVRTRAAAA